MAASRKASSLMGVGLIALNRIAGSSALDKLGLRRSTERAVYHGARTGFKAAGQGARVFATVTGTGTATRQRVASASGESGLFDLTPTPDQEMLTGVVRQFAAEVLRPRAPEAESANQTPVDVMRQSAELGLCQLGVPESLGGLSQERSATTTALVSEALAYGDMGQAVACLAPSAVATAIALWGSHEQQQRYLPVFCAEDVPVAAFVVSEPVPLFDPFELTTTASRQDDGSFVVTGLKSGVVQGAAAELLIVAANLDGQPALFIVEPNGQENISVADDPSMGLRAAGLSRLKLDRAPAQLLGDGSAQDYREAIRLSRLAWSALMLGTARAVLDYTKDYVVTREAFGEPIGYRQSVAFKVADIAIELEGARLVTLKAAARVDQGIDYARESALARKLSAEYAMRIGTDGVQLLGGHGFVTEHPVERWYRDLRAVAVMEGAVLL